MTEYLIFIVRQSVIIETTRALYAGHRFFVYVIHRRETSEGGEW